MTTQAALTTAPFTMAETRPSDQRAVERLRGRHAGQRAFILGNGPSLDLLSGSQLEALGQEVTFVCNFIFLWPRFAPPSGLFTFTPAYFCASESDRMKDIMDFASTLPRETVKLYSHPFWLVPEAWIESREGLIASRPWAADWTWLYRRPYFRNSPLPLARLDGWPDGSSALGVVDGGLMDGKPYLSSGGSVVFDCALQVAVWAGCSEIYLLGVDATQQGHVYDRAGSAIRLHVESRRAMIRTAQVWERELDTRGIKVRSLSPGGNLTVPKVDVKEILGA